MKSDFKIDLLKLSSGSIVNQIITIISAPVIARLYGAESFGVSLVFASFSAILIPFVNARYDVAMVLPPQKKDAFNIAVLALTIFFGDFLFDKFNIQYLNEFKLLIPLSVFIGGFLNILNNWCIREKYFSLLSKAQVITQLVVTLLTLIAAFAGFNKPIVLIISAIIGQFLLLMMLLIKLSKNDFYLLKMKIRFYDIKEIGIRYIDFPKFSSLATIFNTVSWQAPIMLLGFFFSSTVVGFYGLGFRLIQAPMSLVGNAFNQVFYHYGSIHKTEGILNENVESLFIWIFKVAFSPCLVLLFSGYALFSFVFGAIWHEAGVYVQLLSPWAFTWFISSPLSPVYSIAERQRDEVKVHFMILLFRIFPFIIGGMVGSPRIAILLFSIGGVVSYLYLLQQIFIFSGANIVNSKKEILKILQNGLIISIPVLISTLLSNNMILIFVISTLTFILHLFLIFKQQYNV